MIMLKDHLHIIWSVLYFGFLLKGLNIQQWWFRGGLGISGDFNLWKCFVSLSVFDQNDCFRSKEEGIGNLNGIKKLWTSRIH